VYQTETGKKLLGLAEYFSGTVLPEAGVGLIEKTKLMIKTSIKTIVQIFFGLIATLPHQISTLNYHSLLKFFQPESLTGKPTRLAL